MTIEETVLALKQDERFGTYDLPAIKQFAVLRVLSALGWDLFSAQEVIPDHNVVTSVVSYGLRVRERDQVLIEVVRPVDDLDVAQVPLLDACVNSEVAMAVLTTGMQWWFYLPLTNGTALDRRFAEVDFRDDEIVKTVSTLSRYLDRKNHTSGRALLDATTDASRHNRGEIVTQSLSNAMREILSEPNDVLVRLLMSRTRMICGFTPSREETVVLLQMTGRPRLVDDPTFVVSADFPAGAETRLSSSGPQFANGRLSNRTYGNITVMFDGQRIDASSIPRLYRDVLTRLIRSGRIRDAALPWGVGSKRYLVVESSRPRHPSGKPFFNPVSVQGFAMEAHVNRESGLRYLKAFCESLSIPFRVVEH